MRTDKELCETCQELLNLLTDGSIGKMMADNTIEQGVTGESEEFVALVTIGWLFNKGLAIAGLTDN